ncbi:MAG: hypothetical protein U0168_01745 [Nannocystaceae bacterium]
MVESEASEGFPDDVARVFAASQQGIEVHLRVGAVTGAELERVPAGELHRFAIGFEQRFDRPDPVGLHVGALEQRIGARTGCLLAAREGRRLGAALDQHPQHRLAAVHRDGELEGAVVVADVRRPGGRRVDRTVGGVAE